MYKKFTLLISALIASMAFSAQADDGDVISFTYSYYNNQTMYARVLSEADKTAELIPNPDGVTVYNMSQSSMWITPTNANGYTIVSIGENAFKNARIGQPTNYTAGLSAGFTTIKADAFNGATRNGSVISVFRINAEMADISPKAFRNNKIKWFDFRTNEQSVNYGNLNHILTNVEKTKLVAFPGNYVAVSGSSQLQTTSLPTGSVATSYTIPSQITTIGAYAFSDNSKLQTLNLGSVTTIEEQACANMSALKTLTIPATVTSIEADAFTGTTGITTLNVKCEWNDDLADVVFDDAVYERLIDNVNWQCSDESKALFKANANWGRFFTGGGAPLQSYSISYGNMTNGSVTGPAEADNGMPVTLTVTPANLWYELGTLTVTDADNNPVSTTPGENGTFTFMMPASNVTVNATFVEGHKLFMMGSMNGWDGNNTENMVELAYDTTAQTYSVRQPLPDSGDGYAYFRFKDINSQYGPSGGSDKEITEDDLNTDISITPYYNDKAFKITAGENFTFTVNADKNNLVVIGIDKTPFDVGKFSYRRVSEDEVEMLGYNENYPNESLLKANFQGLSTVTYEGTSYKIVSIGEEAFAGRGLGGSFTIADMTYLREIKKGAFRNVGDASSAIARPITLPSSLQTLGDEVFAGSYMSTLTIPAAVTHIGNGIVAGNYRLPSIAVASGNTAYKATNGDLYTIDGKALVAAAPQKATLTVAEGCEIIAPKAVMNIPTNNTATGHMEMKTIVLPSTLQTIGENAFAGSTTFTIITCNATVPPSGAVFEVEVYNYIKTNETITVPAEALAAYQADDNWKKFFNLSSTKIYLLGDYNVGETSYGWAANNGVEMTYSHGAYTATITTDGHDNGYTYFAFTTALAENNDDGGWTYIAPFRFGATGDGNHTLAESELGTAIPATGTQNIGVPAGTWTIKVENVGEENQQVTITGTWPTTKYYYNANGQVVELTVNNGTATYALNTENEVYFNFAKRLDSGSMPMSYFGTASNYDVQRTDIGNVITLTDGEGFFKLPAGEWTLTLGGLNTNTRTLTISGVWPSNGRVYMLGTNQNWNPNDGSMELTYDPQSQTYSIEFIAQSSGAEGEEDYNFFCFTKALGSWSEIANSRFGAETDQYLLEFPEGEYSLTSSLRSPSSNTFKIAAGEQYALTLNYDLTELTVTTYDKSPFTDGVVYYKPISYNECEIIPHPNGTAYNLSSSNTTVLDKEVATNAHGDVFSIVGIAKFAFRNATFPSNGNFNMPHKIRYVADSAFQGVKSGSSTSRGSIRFYGNTLRYLSSTAFLNNQLQGSVLVSSGDAENGFAQVSSDVTSPSTSGGSMYLIAERGTKYILFPNSYPLGNSNGWEPANKITINANIKEIGAYAMMNITNYKTVIMSNVEVIDTAAFMNSGVTTLNLGNALISIGPDAFTGATGITTITISTATPPAVESDFEQAVYNRNNVLNLTGDAAANKLAYMAHPIWGKFFKGSTLQATLDGATDGEARKVSDALTIAMVDADEEVLYMADDNGAAAQAPEDGWIDFVGEHLGKPYSEYSHNNWLAVKVADAAEYEAGMVVATLVGTLNKTSATLNAAAIELADGTSSVTPNTYIVANLGGPTQLYGLSTFFFMQPVVNEVVTVTWAQYAGNGLFKVPDNASYFTGQLQVVGEMTGLSPVEGNVYTLDGALVAQEATDGQKSRDGSLVMKNANVYQDQSIITGLGALRVNDKVTGVRYYNVAGMVSDRPFEGVNIVVTTYADGTQNVSKVIK